VAALIVATIFTPSAIWRHPSVDAIYTGFDPNLISVSEKGFPYSDLGRVEVAPDELKISTVSSSAPAVHLVTTSLPAFTAETNLRILENPPGTDPLRISIWNPRVRAGYSLDFGPAPNNLLSAKAIADGVVAQTLVGGRIVKSEHLGSYSPGHLYHLAVAVEKASGMISVQLSGSESPPSQHAMLSLLGGPADPNYADIVSAPVSVHSGETYEFGGLVKSLSGSDAYKVTLFWLDRQMKPIGSSNDWRPLHDLNGWTRKSFTAVAPPNAAQAQLYLGSGNGTLLLFTDLFVNRAALPSQNLLVNGELQRGTEGWVVLGSSPRRPDLIDPHPVAYRAQLRREELPELFNSVRLALTVSAASQKGTSRAALRDYVLTLPHASFWTDKVADARATGLTIALVFAGVLLGIARLWILVSDRRGKRVRTLILQVAEQVRRFRPSTASLALGGFVVVAFLGANSLLFRLAVEPFDMGSQTVWAYIASSMGPAHLYFLPNIVSLAHVWGGVPYHEAVFPYEPILGYIFAMLGWIYRLVLAAPDAGPNSSQMIYLIKAANLLFGLVDGALIYLILRQLKLSQGSSVTGASLFLFNPAVWFSMSVLGLTHVISISFVMAAIWLALREHALPAWLMLALAALSRPQMLVAGWILGAIFLRTYSLRKNLHAIAFTIIILFILLVPVALSTSPSLTVDVVWHALQLQEGGGNEQALTTVSLNATSVWPLMTYLIDHQHGALRFSFPSSNTLAAGLSYQRFSQFILVALLVIVAALALVRTKKWDEHGMPYFLLAFGFLGFLMFGTGLAATHFVLGLPFLLICRKWLNRAIYGALITAWSLTTFIPMFGSLGTALSGADYLLRYPLSGRNQITTFFADLSTWDPFITLAVSINLVVLATLAIAGTRSCFPRRREMPSSTRAALGSLTKSATS